MTAFRSPYQQVYTAVVFWRLSVQLTV